VSAAIVGVGAVSAFGVGFRGLGRAVRAGRLAPAPSRELSACHPGTLASEVPPLPPALDAGDARSRKLMSRAARFGAIAIREALPAARVEVGSGRDEIGAWFGVGASGASMDDVPAILRASLHGGRLDLESLGERGLSAVNPLFTFQTLNNFTLCHGAILEGLGGPNSAFFSRGRGTEMALVEALFAIESGDCACAVAGAADTALHPVTWAEMVRGGFAARGLVPGEGAAAFVLARHAERPLARIAPCAADERAELTVVAHWGPGEPLPAGAVDVSAALGFSLAAAPALAWAVALDLLETSAVVLSRDPDGELSAVRLWRPS
jgi:3-oxoacyl-(acyl-carrier-protein) synthase